MKSITKFQIGKLGVTPGVIESLNLAFKNHKQVRISTLPASGRNRGTMDIMAKSILAGLGEGYDYKIIGFTIILIKIPSKVPIPKRKPKVKK